MDDATVMQLVLRSITTNDKYVIKNDLLVGREVECQIQLDSPQVSRYHAKLFTKGGRVYVRDLQSSNGTFVNGKRIANDTRLQMGDEVAFNEAVFRITSFSGGRSNETVLKPRTTAAQPSTTNAISASSAKPSTPGFTGGVAQAKSATPPVRPLEDSLNQASHRPIPASIARTSKLGTNDTSALQNEPSADLNELSASLNEPSVPATQNEPKEEKTTRFIKLNQNNPNDMNSDIEALEIGNLSGPRLLCMTAPVRGKTFSLHSEESYFTWSIGRNEFSDIVVNNDSASRMHAWVTKMDTIYEIKEENATNGLLVNGEMASSAVLKHGDKIQLGTMAFVYKSDIREKNQIEESGWRSFLSKLAELQAKASRALRTKFTQ